MKKTNNRTVLPSGPIPAEKRPQDDAYLMKEDDKGKSIAVSIRKAEIADVRDILELVNGFASKNLMLSRGPQYLYENVRDFVVAEPADSDANGRQDKTTGATGIIACASLHVLWEDVAEIRSIAIHPQYQHVGLGKKLIDFLKGDAKQLGVHTLFTFTLAEEFFTTLGFVRKKRENLPSKVWGECSRCPKFFKCDEVGMILEIN